MRPALVSEEHIRVVIGELARDGHRVTGVAVRELLAQRFGVRGGVARIYRLLRESAREPTPAAPDVLRVRTARRADETREEAIARADLAEHREQVHQERWAREIDALKARVALAEQDGRELSAARQQLVDLTRALAVANRRIAQLDRHTG
jgi:hypothetical protein